LAWRLGRANDFDEFSVDTRVLLALIVVLYARILLTLDRESREGIVGEDAVGTFLSILKAQSQLSYHLPAVAYKGGAYFHSTPPALSLSPRQHLDMLEAYIPSRSGYTLVHSIRGSNFNNWLAASGCSSWNIIALILPFVSTCRLCITSTARANLGGINI
jgi:hypothetical protein